MKEQTQQIIDEILKNKFATCTVFSDKDGDFGILISNGIEDKHKESFDRILFSNFGINAPDLEEVKKMSKEDLEVFKKIILIRQLKKNQSSLLEEIKKEIEL